MSSKDNKKHMSAAKDTKGTVKRLLGYLGAYKVRFIFVIICIAISSGTVAYSALFIQGLIDNYITTAADTVSGRFFRVASLSDQSSDHSVCRCYCVLSVQPFYGCHRTGHFEKNP